MTEPQDAETRPVPIPPRPSARAGLLGRLIRSNPGTLTLALEGPSLRLLRAHGGRVTGWTTLPFNPRLLRDGRVEDPAALAEVIGNGLARLDDRRGKLVAAFPGSRLTIRVLGVPRMRGVAPEVLIPREARRLLGPTVDQQLLFWTPLQHAPQELRYYLLAVPRAEMTRFIEALQLSGLKPHKIDARPLALARAVPERSAVLLRLEVSDLDVTVVVDRVPQLVTRRDLELSMSPEDLVAEILDALQTTIAFYSNRADSAPLPLAAPVVLCGGHPQIDESLARSIGAAIGREVRSPLSPLEAPPDFPAVEYTVNLGLALK